MDLSSHDNSNETPSAIDPGDERDFVDDGSSSEEEEYFKPIKRLRMMEPLRSNSRNSNNSNISENDEPQQPPPPPPPPTKPEPSEPAEPSPSPNINNKPLTSFLIKDILSIKPPKRSNNVVNSDSSDSNRNIVRPWDLGNSRNSSHNHNHNHNHSNHHRHHDHDHNHNRTHHVHHHPYHNHHHNHHHNHSRAVSNRRPRSADDDSRSERSESDSSESPASVSAVAAGITSPLDALFEMTSKAFDGLDGSEKGSDASADHLNLFSTRAQPKKKRKSRTAFTNHQIFELEKRFLYQKYLSPADRDEIAQSLGLTNAQVITWFQNRRAKLKRDMEELKKDVDAAKISVVGLHHPAHKKSPMSL